MRQYYKVNGAKWLLIFEQLKLLAINNSVKTSLRQTYYFSLNKWLEIIKRLLLLFELFYIVTDKWNYFISPSLEGLVIPQLNVCSRQQSQRTRRRRRAHQLHCAYTKEMKRISFLITSYSFMAHFIEHRYSKDSIGIQDISAVNITLFWTCLDIFLSVDIIECYTLLCIFKPFKINRVIKMALE